MCLISAAFKMILIVLQVHTDEQLSLIITSHSRNSKHMKTSMKTLVKQTFLDTVKPRAALFRHSPCRRPPSSSRVDSSGYRRRAVPTLSPGFSTLSSRITESGCGIFPRFRDLENNMKPTTAARRAIPPMTPPIIPPLAPAESPPSELFVLEAND